MSVHGYPADKSIFSCNLKLGLLMLQEETAGPFHAAIDQDDISLAGVLQGAVGRAVCYKTKQTYVIMLIAILIWR